MVTKTGTSGNDIIFGSSDYDVLSGQDGDDAIIAGAQDDMIYGGSGKDSLTGGDGFDTLDGGTGNDYMEGGTGDDVYYVDSSADVVKELAGGGRDSVYTSVSFYVLANEVEELHFGGATTAKLWGNASDNMIFSGSMSDTLYGGAGSDFIYAGGGSDYVYGGSGNDFLYGSAGADHLEGGVDDDYYYLGSFIEGKGDVIAEAAGGGTDTIITEGNGDAASTGAAGEIHSFTLTAEIENLQGQGNFAFNFTGNAQDNKLYGGNYADTLDGGLGADMLKGYSGSDTYVIENAGDTIVGEATGAVDFDTVRVSGIASWTITEGIERVEIGAGMSTIIGNAENNEIIGTTGAETITGGGGNDSIEGHGGLDRLVGGAGNDVLQSGDDASAATTMVGGTGSDTYVVHNSADKAVELINQGNDIAYVYADWQMGAYIETAEVMVDTGVTLKGNAANNLLTSQAGADTMVAGAGNDTLIGNAGNDSLNGGAGNDSLSGGFGDDTMVGGAGNDVYIVASAGDLVFEGLNSGTDAVAAAISYTLTGNVENLSLFDAAVDGTGNGMNNTLAGNDLANTLSGMAGADLLIGGAGGDTLIGGAGADTFVFGTGDNTNSDSGRDVVATFARGFEKLDVQQVDAVAGSAQVDQFTFLGSSAFSSHAGEMRIETITGGVRVLMDLTGDAVADMAIDVMGVATLTATDFLF
jgi:Ca2+-binding RTX toxin-like protein